MQKWQKKSPLRPVLAPIISGKGEPAKISAEDCPADGGEYAELSAASAGVIFIIPPFKPSFLLVV
jgi:hypothetical protein